MAGFDEIAFAARMRDVIRSIVSDILSKERPRYRYGTVSSINRVTLTCQVYFDNDASNPVTVRMGSTQPLTVGQRVRVAGVVGDKYVDDVIGNAYSLGAGDTAWGVPTLTNSWVNVGGAYANAGYRKLLTGVVILRGAINGGAPGTTAFTLPAGYRPGATVIFPSVGTFAGTSVSVTSAGAVIPNPSSGGTQYLDGVLFLAEN